MKKLITLTLALFLGFAFYTANAQDAKKKTIEAVGAKVEATRGDNANIVTPKPTTDVVAEKPEATRGGSCKVIVDNWTGYAIDIYVDGVWEGTVAAWSDGYTWAIPGKTKLYGLSVGGTMEWGPAWVNCKSEYTWKLTN